RKIGYVVDHCVANPQGCLTIAKHVPREACSRAKVAQVEVVEARVAHPHTDQTRRGITWRTDPRFRSCTRVEIRRDLIRVTKGPVHFPTQAVADSQSRSDFPFILEEDAHGGLVEMAGCITKRARCFIDPAEQHLGKKRRVVSLKTTY